MLILDEYQLKRCLPVNTNTSLQTLRPAIAQAERKHLVPAVGQATIDAMAAAAETESELPEDDPRREILYQLRCAEVRLGWWDSFDLLAVQLSETGLQDANGEHRAYRYQADAARETLRRQGYDHLNQAMLLLDANVELVPVYADAPNYSGNRHSLFPTSEHFYNACRLPGLERRDAMLFSRLRPYLDDTEGAWLPHYVPETVLADCIHRIGGQAEPSEHYSDARADLVLRPLQMAAAAQSLLVALPLLGSDLTAQGYTTMQPTLGDQTAGQAAAPEATARLEQAYRRLGEFQLSNAVRLMAGRTDLFPDLEPYGGTAAKDDPVRRRDNSGRRTVFL